MKYFDTNWHAIRQLRVANLVLAMMLLASLVAKPAGAQNDSPDVELKQEETKTDESESETEPKVEVSEFLNFDALTIDGEQINLGKYAGKVVVVVNVASRCGYTKHYKNLQSLHEKYADQGLAILGFPCNQFGNQEPESEPKIKEFCQMKFGVEFDMFSKVEVKGPSQHEFFMRLTETELQPVGSGEVRWNFEKFVIDRTGTPIARFSTKESPESDEFLSMIETALRQPVPEQFKSDDGSAGQDEATKNSNADAASEPADGADDKTKDDQ